VTDAQIFASAFSIRTSDSFFFYAYAAPRALHSFPTRRSSDLSAGIAVTVTPSAPSITSGGTINFQASVTGTTTGQSTAVTWSVRSADHTSVLQSREYTACRALGAYHVVATSVADTTKTSTAVV